MTQPGSASVVFATRRSQLALAQARAFAAELVAKNQGLSVTELHVVTTGDRIQDRPLADIGGKGLFVKEIEEAILEGRADYAVHSIKDVTAVLAPGLRIGCIPRRADPRDALLTYSGTGLMQLPQGARVGTSSLRRMALLRKVRPDLRFELLRGNVDTRIRKVREGVVDATILACAGLQRLGILNEANEILPVELSLPAVGQGALGIECRSDDAKVLALLAPLHHEETALAVAAERGVMIQVEGSCKIPLAAYAIRTEDQRMYLRAMLADEAAERVAFAEDTRDWPSNDEEAEQMGKDIGERLRRELGS